MNRIIRGDCTTGTSPESDGRHPPDAGKKAVMSALPDQSVRWHRRHGSRGSGGSWQWGKWEVCSQAEAARVTGLRSWEVRSTGAPPVVDPVGQERERCARVADDEARIREEAGKKHAEGSAARDRCFAAARAAANVALGIRAGEVVASCTQPVLPHPIGTIFDDGYWNLNVVLRRPDEVESQWRNRGQADVYTVGQVRELLRTLADDSRDAARYRWLTRHAFIGECFTENGTVLEVQNTDRRVPINGAVNDAIDAAIAAEASADLWRGA